MITFSDNNFLIECMFDLCIHVHSNVWYCFHQPSSYLIISVGVPAVYLALVVPIGYLVAVDDIPGNTHYLYYNDNDDLIA